MSRDMLSCCFIAVVRTDEPPPVAAEIVTDLSEHLPIYNAALVPIAQEAQAKQLPVYLDIQRTQERRHRYVAQIHVMHAEMASRCCISCCTESPQMPATEASGVPYFQCPKCSRQMFIGRVPRHVEVSS